MPTIKPHAFGCKRISLENGFYELFAQPNVHLVDMKQTPIAEITPKGIKTTEKEWEFDLIVCATGFDMITGGVLQMNVQGRGGLHLQEKWQSGVKTFVGMSVNRRGYYKQADAMQVLHIWPSSANGALQRTIVCRAAGRVDCIAAQTHAREQCSHSECGSR